MNFNQVRQRIKSYRNGNSGNTTIFPPVSNSSHSKLKIKELELNFSKFKVGNNIVDLFFPNDIKIYQATLKPLEYIYARNPSDLSQQNAHFYISMHFEKNEDFMQKVFTSSHDAFSDLFEFNIFPINPTDKMYIKDGSKTLKIVLNLENYNGVNPDLIDFKGKAILKIYYK